jgi:hypothetical protein
MTNINEMAMKRIRLHQAYKTEIDLSHFVRTGILFIHIPKTAGISITKSLYNKEVGHLPLRYYEKRHAQTIKNLFKFTVVRNPWDRIYSAYHFLKAGGMPEYPDDKIFFDKNLSIYENFDHFVREWLAKKNVYSYIHFYPQLYFIETRETKFDYISRFEKINIELPSIMSNHGIHIELKKLNTSQKNPEYQSAYSQKSKDIVYKTYKKDISLFKYEF